MTAAIDYATPGPFTNLDAVTLTGLGTDPVALCAPVHKLVIQPTDVKGLDLPKERFEANGVRRVDELLRRLWAVNPAPLTQAREPHERVIGTCRHFAVVACALLRHQGIAARARCGFATYFQPGQGLDHWVIEYRDSDRWVRLDVEAMGLTVLARPEDLRPGEFLTGGEAWAAYRRGEIDGTKYGVYGTENFGPSEIRSNAVKDLAAINKVEMLPWDEWGRITEAFEGRTGEDYDLLLDELAEVCAADDPAAVNSLYQHKDLRVPDSMIS